MLNACAFMHAAACLQSRCSHVHCEALWAPPPLSALVLLGHACTSVTLIGLPPMQKNHSGQETVPLILLSCPAVTVVYRTPLLVVGA